MLKFLRRLIQPEIDRLTLELNQTKLRLDDMTRQRDWYEGLYDQAVEESKRSGKELDARVKRSVAREDALARELVSLAVHRQVSLPSRNVVPVDQRQAQAAQDQGIEMLPAAENLLRARAKEYLEAKGEEVTEDATERVYQEMKRDSAYWLSDAS